MSTLGQKLIYEARRVAAANPDFVYAKVPEGYAKRCVYLQDGCPSCIIGHALWNVGLINEEFKGDNLALSDIGHVVLHYQWHLDVGEIEWLYRVQVFQDQGKPWAGAIQYADREIDALGLPA